MRVSSVEKAWYEAKKIFPTYFEKDKASSERAGYDIYRHPTLNYYSRICDLGDRLEVLTGDFGENVTNIWIEPKGEAEETTQAPEYGRMLADQIRESSPNYSDLSEFEKFILNRGYKFNTEEELKAGYDRAWKSSRNILITEEEFVAEAGKCYEVETLKAAYAALVKLVEQKKLQPEEVYSYAYFGWCLRNPDAIVAYEYEPNKWKVNDCGTAVLENRAIMEINSEWGFEASRIQIIGTPYYDASDFQFIRFDCAHMTWLWKNGNLYQVYA